VVLQARELSAGAFAPYGRVIEAPARSGDATGPGWTWWAETVLLPGDGRPWGVGCLTLEPSELRFDWAERHMRTLEAVVPTGGDAFVYVGPPEHRDEPARLPDLGRFEVFRVPVGAGVVLDRGVWHGAPFAAGGSTAAFVLLLEGTGRTDVALARFPDTPVAFVRGTDP
jgi:ureidoglycolate lyase